MVMFVNTVKCGGINTVCGKEDLQAHGLGVDPVATEQRFC